MSVIAKTASFLAHYLQFFGDRTHLYIDLLPEDDDGGERDHLALDQKFKMAPEDVAENFDKYVHPCWCNAELIYADDKRGNEVWLHKRVQ